jgi:biopolymer transport protein ExbD
VVLLVKIDKYVSLAQFLEISEIARSAGFDRVQVAGDRTPAGDPSIPLNVREE